MSGRGYRYEEHFYELARKHGVEVVIRGSGLAYRRQRRVTIPEVRGQVSYMVALHELGHVVGEMAPLRLGQEAAAWRWALANSIEEPTLATWKSILRCLDSYHARQQWWQSMKESPEFEQLRSEVAGIVGEPRPVGAV